jgi:predicted secreted protein
MATLVGNNGVVKIDATLGGSLAIVAGVRNFTVEMTADTIETTTMSNDTRTYRKGLSTWSGSADIYLDDENLTTGATYTAIAPLILTSGTVGEQTVSLELYLKDSNNKFNGEAIITGFTINSSFDGMVEASITFQGTAGVTYTA